MTIPISIAKGGPLQTMTVPPQGLRLLSGTLFPAADPHAYLFALTPQSEFVVCVRAEVAAAYIWGNRASA